MVATEGFDLETFKGGIDAFLGYSTTAKKAEELPTKREEKPAEAPAPAYSITPLPAAPKASTRGETVSEAAPADALEPEVQNQLEKDLEAMETPSPAAPKSLLQNGVEADRAALTAHNRTTTDKTCDIDLIVGVRAVVRGAMLANQTYPDTETFVRRVCSALKREISPALVLAAYGRMLELEAPGGPLCVWRKTPAKGVSKADISKAARSAESIKARRKLEEAEQKAKSEAQRKEAEELRLDDASSQERHADPAIERAIRELDGLEHFLPDPEIPELELGEAAAPAPHLH